MPYTLGDRARFVIDRIEPRGAREMAYRVRADVRGRYHVGPLTVRLADPFGLVELARSFSAAAITVTPPIVPLPPGRLTGSWTGGGGSRARMIASAGEDDVAPREYRHGDDLRRVHWRSTARRGELMVRREEAAVADQRHPLPRHPAHGALGRRARSDVRTGGLGGRLHRAAARAGEPRPAVRHG